jgi:hypothetical protein
VLEYLRADRRIEPRVFDRDRGEIAYVRRAVPVVLVGREEVSRLVARVIEQVAVGGVPRPGVEYQRLGRQAPRGVGKPRAQMNP